MSGLRLASLVLPVPLNSRDIAFETTARPQASAGVAPVIGRRYLQYFRAYNSKPFSSLEIYTGAGAPVSVTAARIALYSVDPTSFDLTMLCRTANDATIGAAASTTYNRALDATGGYPTTFALTPGLMYAAGFYITAGTNPTVYGYACGAGGPAAVAPRVAGFDSGAGTDLNTSIAAASVTASAIVFYVAGV